MSLHHVLYKEVLIKQQQWCGILILYTLSACLDRKYEVATTVATIICSLMQKRETKSLTVEKKEKTLSHTHKPMFSAQQCKHATRVNMWPVRHVDGCTATELLLCHWKHTVMNNKVTNGCVRRLKHLRARWGGNSPYLWMLQDSQKQIKTSWPLSHKEIQEIHFDKLNHKLYNYFLTVCVWVCRTWWLLTQMPIFYFVCVFEQDASICVHWS